MPDLDWKLMKEKLRDLRRGIDNTNYIDRQRTHLNNLREAQ